MSGQLVGTFAVAEAFFLTGRGLALVGQLTGRVGYGQHLVFATGTRLRITGVSISGRFGEPALVGLLVEATAASRAEAMQAGFVEAVAQIFAQT